MHSSLITSEPCGSLIGLKKKKKKKSDAKSNKSLSSIDFRPSKFVFRINKENLLSIILFNHNYSEVRLLDAVESCSYDDQQIVSSSSAHSNPSNFELIDLVDSEDDSNFLPMSGPSPKKPKMEIPSCNNDSASSNACTFRTNHWIDYLVGNFLSFNIFFFQVLSVLPLEITF